MKTSPRSFGTAVILLCLLTIPFVLQATHNLGGTIRMTLKDSATYTYTLTILTYTDPAPAGVDRCSMNLFVVDMATGQLIDTISSIPRSNGPISTQVPSDCPLPQGTPRNGIWYAGTIKKNLYSVDYSFDGPGRYQVYTYDLARTAGIANINKPEETAFWISGELIIPASGPLDQPPYFLNEALDYACNAGFWTNLPGGIDPDGDSLAYELLTPQHGDLPTVPYHVDVSGYKLPSDTTFGVSTLSMDPQTGLITWNMTSVSLGMYAIAYQATSYRNGVKMSVIQRELYVEVLDCTNNPPNIQSAPLGAINVGDTVTQTFLIWEPDSADSLYVAFNTGDLGPNGPFSSLSTTAPTIQGIWWDAKADSSIAFSSLPMNGKNDPGFPADTVKITIQWVPENPLPTNRFEVNLAAWDNESYFVMIGNTQLTTYFASVIQVNYTTDVSDQWDARIRVFPNPASDQIEVVHDAALRLESYRIVDLHGRTVLQGRYEGSPISLKDISSGAYFLLIDSASGHVFRQKIIRN